MVSEHYEQALFVQWFRRTYPGILLFAIPNGSYRSKAAGAALKVEGVVKGIPDLFVPAWRLWIEMKKSKGGVVSPEQKDIISQLKAMGYGVIIGKGFEDARKQIESMVR